MTNDDLIRGQDAINVAGNLINENDDLIRRGDALDALCVSLSVYLDSNKLDVGDCGQHIKNMNEYDKKAILSLPAVKGEWVKVYHNGRKTTGHIECSICGWWRSGDWTKHNFCPNCGADMREENNG